MEPIGPVVTYRQAEIQTGLNRVTLWRFIKDGRLEMVKLGSKAVRITQRSIDQLIANGLQK